MSGEHSVQRVLRIDDELDQEILSAAQDRHESMSVVMRDLLRRGIRDYFAERQVLESSRKEVDHGTRATHSATGRGVSRDVPEHSVRPATTWQAARRSSHTAQPGPFDPR